MSTSIFNRDADDSQGQMSKPDPTPPTPPAAPAAPATPDVKAVILSANRREDALPEGLTNIGMIPVTLPDQATQAAGFYLDKETAAALVGQFPQYKFYVNKGQTTPSVSI